jgi:hypothetical protein
MPLAFDTDTSPRRSQVTITDCVMLAVMNDTCKSNSKFSSGIETVPIYTTMPSVEYSQVVHVLE